MKIALKSLEHTNKGKYCVSMDQILDPRISQIEEKYAKFCPKFLDFCASIYTVVPPTFNW
jgi:hypothetical protein